ncbi:serine/threonine protein kinase [Pyxidicoccus fallax]|uniref:Serine/threonine protein kinase n=1 Tax=Pyxidicoccus fallax TaxID=394095 RepID=A0A848LA28_9BACT|nr:serine/threonine-protein kinase [Pyxidicoccus fallax]NMO15910.1 serine/threonine protein kinase [Pyxidicoccus fallax]NPC81318.1 serine/threonine protein kinase [Pyxidicoccus fallax]
MHAAHLNPARLPLGTRVGPWRVLERRGLGAYGAVYRAIGVQDSSGPVALKLALHPQDERFAREVELLSRIRHPSVPRLVDHGVWRQSSGLDFPYLAMEWVDGVSLYEWAHEQRPGSRQVLHVLASLARALEATHASGGVHRDVKGDNVLVSDAEGRAFLTDFGSGHYLGAATLTQPPFPPGTPAYRSPEAWRSVRLPMVEPIVPYAPGPADDVFALGVTAFRLVTGEYPFPPEVASQFWREEVAGAPSVHALNPRCCQELSELTSRMLSLPPEARGSARELAEALEEAVRHAGPEADGPLFEREAPRPVESRVEPRPVHRRAPGRSRHVWLSAASLAGALALGAGWMLRAQLGEGSVQEHASVEEAAKDGGTVAVGDAALTAPVPLSEVPVAWSIVAVDVPPGPLPGQRRPDANGHCPSKPQVPINGGCWLKVPVELKDCGEDYYVYKGGCYMPVIRRGRPPTSSPATRAGDAGTEH